MDRQAQQLFAQYYADVYRYLYSLSRDASLSEELAAEVFLEAVRTLGCFRGDCQVKTWLFSIARHRWLKYLEKKKTRPPAQPLTEFLQDPAKGPEQTVQDRQLQARIRQLLQAEPERTRAVVLLRLEGRSFYEIGQQCGISESSARVIDCRARARLRAILQKEEWYP